MINSSCYDQAWFRQATPIDNTDESESVFKMYSKTRTSPVQVYLFFTLYNELEISFTSLRLMK